MADPIRETSVQVLTGEADIDVSEFDYVAAHVVLLTITPQAGSPLEDAWLDIDLAKAVTGFAVVNAAQTIIFAIQRKIDGTNWRPDLGATTAALSGTNAAGQGRTFNLGTIDPTEQVRLTCLLSAETGGDCEFPYRLRFKGVAPTITAEAN